MKKLTTTVLMIMTLFMVMTTVTASEDVDVLQMYDKNNDGMIDTDERLILDIDIESGRITVDESTMAAMFTTDDTIILNDEIQDFAMGDVNDQTPVVESTVAPVVVPVVESVVDPEPAAPVVPEPVEPEVQNAAPVIGVVGIVGIIVGIILLAMILRKRG